MKKLFLILACFAGTQLQAQTPVEYYVSETSANVHYTKPVSLTDGSGNTFIAGTKFNLAGNNDLFLVKYNSSGNVVWSAIYAGSSGGNDYATAIKIDPSGNIYVSGATYAGGQNYNALLLKYNSSGSKQWEATWNSSISAEDYATALHVDAANSVVYVTGTTKNTSGNMDFICLKYTDGGSFVWANSAGYASNDDVPNSIYMKGSRLYSGGGSLEGTTGKLLLVEWNTSTGAVINTQASGSTSMQFTNLTSIDGDAAGNIYLGGGKLNTGTGMDIFVMKLDDDLNVLWTQNYNSDESNYDVANAIHVDKNGNVVVGGKSEIEGEESNYTVIKYNSSGTQQWVASFNGTKNGADEVTALNSDVSGNIYVTGTSFNGMNKDFHTIKYNTSGTKQWEISHNSIKNADDIPYGIAKVGDMVLVCGHTGDGNPSNYKLVQYQELEMIVPPDDELISSAYGYQANNGQIVDNNGDLVPEIKYESTNGFPKAYFSDDKVHFVLAKIDTIRTTEDTLYRMDMSFNNNNSPQIYASKRNESYANYFLGRLAEPVTAVPNYKQLIMNDVWSGIDIIYSSNNKGFKMYIICEAGVDPATVSLKFEGAQNLSSSGNNILLETAIGDINFSRVTAYQIYDNERAPFETEPSIVIDGEDLNFHFEGGYDYLAPVVIEISIATESFSSVTNNPGNLRWSTYYGGTGNEYFSGVTNDDANKTYVSGSTSNSHFPNNQGTFFPYNAEMDAVLVKFDALGQREWVIFYGGSENDIATSVAVSGNNVFIVGYSYSQNITNVTPSGAYSQSYTSAVGTNNFDGIIAKFNPAGNQRIWATYYGGLSQDLFYKIKADNFGSIVIVGQTSSTNFPIKFDGPGSPYTQPCSYNTQLYSILDDDGVIVKFTNNGVRTWAACLGGKSEYEYLQDLAIKSDGSISVVGTGRGYDYPMSSTSYYDQSYNGDDDAVVTTFDANGSRTWSTFLGGNGYDYGDGIEYDSNDNLYVIGTTGSNNFPLLNPGGNAFMDSTVQNFDLFISKFSSNNNLIWSTYYGDEWSFSHNITIDNNDRVYIAGAGLINTLIFPNQQLSGVYVNPSTTSLEQSIGFLISFKNSVLDWATYYNGNKTDYPNCLSVDNNYSLYLVGSASSVDDFPLNDDLGVPYFQDTLASPNNNLYDAYIARFNIEPSVFVSNKSTFAINQKFSANVYPNPSSGHFIIESKESWKNLSIEVMDINSKLLKSFENIPDAKLFHFNLSEFSSGIYLLNLKSEKMNETLKIILE